MTKKGNVFIILTSNAFVLMSRCQSLIVPLCNFHLVMCTYACKDSFEIFFADRCISVMVFRFHPSSNRPACTFLWVYMRVSDIHASECQHNTKHLTMTSFD